MLKLILVRHAKSDWAAPGLDDHDRPLNARGRRDAPRMGAWLVERGHRPTQALISTALRAVQTWDGLAEGLGDVPAAEFLPTLYHADPEPLMQHVRGAAGQSVLIVAHNPGLAAFAQQIVAQPPETPAFFDFPTAATLVLDLGARDWRDAAWRSARVLDFAVPRQL